jgi:hypothetical protein
MKKNLFLVAAALAALVSCTSDEFVGEQNPQGSNETGGAISFNYYLQKPTRAENVTGAAAAIALGNQFIVYGEKNEAQTNDGADGKDAATAANLVFNNYQVNYVTNSALTSTSNTEGWEYVGYTHSSAYQSGITTKNGNADVVNAYSTAQTIKYWDWGASNYTFTAVSADQTNLGEGKVTIQKLTSDATNVYGKGYKIHIAADADPSKVFLSDRKVITKSTNTDRTQDNAYGGNVTLSFRNLLSQIRVGMYETVPGYTVTINSFEYATTPASVFDDMGTPGTDKFYANVPNVATTSAADLVVTYWDSSSGAENTPKVAISGTTGANYLALGGADAEHTGLKENVVLATTIASPTYNETTGAFTAVYPQEANTTSLKLKVNYTLTAGDTGETITVEDATAEIPAAYLQWKPNFRYTYIFKISDNTNGYTGGSSDPAGLYPITFDAIEIVAENGEAEYITSVSEPSITTIGVKDGKYSVGNTDYDPSTDVYATVMDASALATLSSSNFSIYDVTSSDATNFPVTEASVAEALIEGPTWTKDQADLKKITCAAGPALTFQKTVPAEDGTTKTLHATDNKAAKFTTVTGKKYAIVYQKTAATYTVDGGNTYSSDAFTAAGTLYTTSECTTVATSDYYSSHSSDTYYKRTAVSNKGIYAIKIVTVE